MLALAKQNLNTPYKFQATPTRIDVVAFTTNQKPYQDCMLNDGRQEERVRIFQGKGIALDPNQHIGRPLIFNITGKQGRQGIMLGGFWQSDAQLPAASEPYQNIPQTAQDAKSTPPDWDAIARGKVRHGIVCAIIQHGGLEKYNTCGIAVIEGIVDYITCLLYTSPSPRD